MDTRKSTIPPPSNWNGAGRGEDEVEAREEVEERGVDALHDRSEDDERGCGDDERGERDVGRHEVRLIGVRSIAAWGRILPEKILGALPAVKGYRRNVSASLLVRERSCTRYAAGLSTPKVRLMEAGLDRVRSSLTVILPSENCVLAEQNNRSS